MSSPPPPVPQPSRAVHRGLAIAPVAAVLALGAVVGVVSTLYATALLRFGGLHVSVGALIAVGTNLLVGLFAAWGLGGGAGQGSVAALPGLGWFAAVAVMILGPTPGGDVVVPGSGWDVGAFLAAGIVGALLAVAITLRTARRQGRTPSETSSAQASPGPGERR